MKLLRCRSSFDRYARRAVGLLIGGLLLIVPARAQEAERRVTLKEALDLFVQHNLTLRVVRAEADAQAGLILPDTANHRG